MLTCLAAIMIGRGALDILFQVTSPDCKNNNQTSYVTGVWCFRSLWLMMGGAVIGDGDGDDGYDT
jgi:hypothetical protein